MLREWFRGFAGEFYREFCGSCLKKDLFIKQMFAQYLRRQTSWEEASLLIKLYSALTSPANDRYISLKSSQLDKVSLTRENRQKRASPG